VIVLAARHALPAIYSYVSRRRLEV
jgi:hypothetical protein